MQKNYFEDFPFIEEVSGAKSLSFRATQENTPFSQALFRAFEDILNSYEERFRVSLHTSSEDDLHNMVIGMRAGSFVYPHKHKKSESYQILSGAMLLVYFDESGVVTQSTLLSCTETLIARVNKNRYHGVIALENVVYHETRIGPFVAEGDSFFAPWLGKNRDEYMKNLLKESK